MVDGGTHWFPPSRGAVRENRDGIVRQLRSEPSDVLLLQEIARGGTANYWTDLKTAVDRSLPEQGCAYLPDIFTRWVPFPFSLEHGLATYARARAESVDAQPLPSDGDLSSGWFKKRYVALVARFPLASGAGSWSVINIHLAAFDPAADLRRRQVEAVLSLAQDEHAAGRFVVIGGDWNLRLATTAFPYTTEPRHLEWLADFDPACLPPGWRLAADGATASVRTDEKPYVAGENYTAVIDGFVVSPNVRVCSVSAVDLGFRHSDHQPVRAVVEAVT